MSAAIEAWVAVPHGEGKIEHLARRTADGLLARINESPGRKPALWVLREPCYNNGWAQELVLIRGKKFASLLAAKTAASKEFERATPAALAGAAKAAQMDAAFAAHQAEAIE